MPDTDSKNKEYSWQQDDIKISDENQVAETPPDIRCVFLSLEGGSTLKNLSA